MEIPDQILCSYNMKTGFDQLLLQKGSKTLSYIFIYLFKNYPSPLQSGEQ